MIKIACWNIRGLNSPLKQKEIRSYVSNNNISIIGLLEVKVRQNNLDVFTKRTLRHWEVIHNTQPNSVARIWLGIDPNKFHAQTLHIGEQCITCKLTAKTCDQDSFIISTVNGYNERSRKRELWACLRYLKSLYGNQP